MRLHQLTLRGVGPFRDEFTVEFDAEGQRLLLIDGDTGSGKSTIIDAIVFALYGEPADAAAKDRMVSDFLPAGFAKAERPFVELVFTVERGTFRVRREPAYDYVNSNGREASQNTTLRLERLTNETSTEGELVSHAVSEGSSELRRLIQLDRSQFMSTIVLAQGQFATFLRAGDEERTKILMQVFQTSKYEIVDRKLQELSKQARQQRNAAEDVLEREATRFHDAAHLDLTQDEWRDYARETPDAAVADADERVSELTTLARDASATRQSATTTASAARDAATAAQQAAKAVQDKRTLLAERGRLQDRAPAIAELQRALDRHARATAIQPARLAWQTRDAQLTSADRALSQCRASLHPVDADTLTAPGSPDEAAQDDAAQDAVNQLTAELAQLTRLVRLEAELAGRKATLEAAAARIDELVDRQREAADQSDALPQRITDLEALLAEARLAAADSAKHEAALAVADEGLAAAHREATAALAQEDAETALEQAGERLREVTAAAHVIEQNFHANLAGILVEALVAGQPCTVCGSTEHPAPAAPADADSSRAALDAARAQVDRARSGVEAATTHLATVRSERAAAAGSAKGRSVDEWEVDRTAATRAIEAARAAGAKAAQVQADLAETRERHAQLQTTIQQLQVERSASRAQLDGDAAQLTKDENEVATARGDAASVSVLAASLSERRTKVEAWRTAWAARQTAQSSAATARESFDEALSRGGFAFAKDLDQALLSDPDRASAEADVTQHAKRTIEVDARLAEDLAAVDEATEVDVDGPAATADAAHAAMQTAVAQHQAAEQSCQDARARLEDLRTAADAMVRAASLARPIVRMADIVHGGGDKNPVPLSRYVILRRFKDVLAAANERLHKMSDGRYHLRADVTAKDGRKATRGLGLRVFDERTEQQRDVKTLSGGETFYTSLALALGLADVVQAEAGGVQLGTLFVDEGFGSLDAETLDAVMDVLTGLTRGDRMVGVISHVTEMKQTISHRIHVVRPDRDGPSTIVAPQ